MWVVGVNYLVFIDVDGYVVGRVFLEDEVVDCKLLIGVGRGIVV